MFLAASGALVGMSEVALAVDAMSGIEIGAGALDVLDACAERV
jgi:hypothetical protein